MKKFNKSANEGRQQRVLNAEGGRTKCSLGDGLRATVLSVSGLNLEYLRAQRWQAQHRAGVRTQTPTENICTQKGPPKPYSCEHTDGYFS